MLLGQKIDTKGAAEGIFRLPTASRGEEHQNHPKAAPFYSSSSTIIRKLKESKLLNIIAEAYYKGFAKKVILFGDTACYAPFS